MNSLRIARAAVRARSAAVKVPLQRRGYAEAVSDKVGNSGLILPIANSQQIKLSLALPHQVRSNIYKSEGIGLLWDNTCYIYGQLMFGVRGD